MGRIGGMLGALLLVAAAGGHAQDLSQPGPAAPATAQPAGVAGPFNIDFPVGGDEVDAPLAGRWTVGGAAGWSLTTWVELRDPAPAPVLVGGVGGAGAAAYLAVAAGRVAWWDDIALRPAGKRVGPGWHLLSAVGGGGRVRLAVDGARVADLPVPAGFAPAQLRIAPRGVAGFAPFGGRVAGFTLTARALDDAALAGLARTRPDAATIAFDTGSPTWPVQVKNMTGLTKPQAAWTLPVATSPPDAPVAIPAYAGPALVAAGPARWTLARWSLADATAIAADGAALSQPGAVAGPWIAATVPGTVLTTLVDRGVYPDPGHGLNNLRVPDSLARHDWWYRATFDAPADLPARQLLTFNGINYAAEVWLNGERLGDVRGAFTRGQFDVTGRMRPGANAVAVRIHPPLHPGTPHEQSLAAGWGPNGGLQAMDGPTFFATEGWDWIPGVRDRNIGLWQDVVLSGSGALRLGDPQIVTTLPHGDASVAAVEIDVAVDNSGNAAITADVGAAFDGVTVRRTVTAVPGATVVRFLPADFPQLTVARPKLWWPNGYGDPALHTAHLTVAAGGVASDARDVRFGMRAITYELSLMTPAGRVRRVAVDFAAARARGEQVVDPSRDGIRRVPGGWVESLTAVGDQSPAVADLADTALAPYLVIRVNGVRIAARGGSWGMDDFMKRSSRAQLEPFFRLHRDAHVNIIRNWVGQNTEPAFYDLADEYGLLVTNDFWASTQDYQMEPEDPALFLANAADTIARYRTHPSIVAWFGRNEGVPPRLINDGLERLTRTLDGTRWYTGSSNSVNLWFSGPYDYQPPETYFTTHAKGFAVEVGSMSFPTREAFEAMVPPADRWPLSDSWAYHDWHQNGNGDTHGFVAAMDRQLGPATDLADFERKAQLMNFDTYRAIVEGMNAGLWTTTSGRMLWMTQPAWGSTMWQLYSHDTDTHAAFYAFRSAAERVHVQMTLPDHRLQLVNNSAAPLTATLTARVMALDGRDLASSTAAVTAAPRLVADGPRLDLGAALAREGAVIVALDAVSGTQALSHNVYWVAADDAGWRRIATMPPQPVTIAASAIPAPDGEPHPARHADQHRGHARTERQADRPRGRRDAGAAGLLR